MLSDNKVATNWSKFKSLSKERAHLSPIIKSFQSYQQIKDDIKSAKEIVLEDDPDIKSMAKDEIAHLEGKIAKLTADFEVILLPKDPNDDANIYIEIRAGTGGDEAAIFSGDLFSMYSRYAENKGWHTEIISQSYGDHGGFKEIITKVSGSDVYSCLKFESGVHRVQRVPETESQGRIHTSACTVAVMPEADQVKSVEITPADLKVDTFRASGAGGQHVNKTDSAIRVTHLPTGIVVECQAQRSQHKNRTQAMSILKSRLLQKQIDNQRREQASRRKSLVGTGDRSERIRTYNYPQGRITDHRINLTLYKLQEIMQGSLDEIIRPITQEYQSDLLEQINDE